MKKVFLLILIGITFNCQNFVNAQNLSVEETKKILVGEKWLLIKLEQDNKVLKVPGELEGKRMVFKPNGYVYHFMPSELETAKANTGFRWSITKTQLSIADNLVYSYSLKDIGGMKLYMTLPGEPTFVYERDRSDNYSDLYEMFKDLILVEPEKEARTAPYPIMIKVEGGSFQMGDEEKKEVTQLPVHTVTLTTFNIAKTETTVLQWKTFCDATGRKMPKAMSRGWIDDNPMVNVSWDEAVAYCDWMSKKTGKLYRLPTEAEWEYAARGGKQSKRYKYSGGQGVDSVGWYSRNSMNEISTVALKQPNELGLYDLSGNVDEWCQDMIVRYGYEAGAQTNPIGAKTGTYRVTRGGSYMDDDGRCKASARLSQVHDVRIFYTGFRVVVDQ